MRFAAANTPNGSKMGLEGYLSFYFTGLIKTVKLKINASYQRIANIQIDCMTKLQPAKQQI